MVYKEHIIWCRRIIYWLLPISVVKEKWPWPLTALKVYSCNTSTIMFRLFFGSLLNKWGMCEFLTKQCGFIFWDECCFSDFSFKVSLICRKQEKKLRKKVLLYFFLKIHNQSLLLNARRFKKVRSLLFMNFLFTFCWMFFFIETKKNVLEEGFHMKRWS